MGLFDRIRRTRDEPATPTAPTIEPEVNDVILKALLNDEKIDREKAMTIPIVASAVDFISSTIASMPVKLYKVRDDKVEELTKDTRVKLLNEDTGDTLNAYQMKKAMVEDYLMGKGGYCYIRRFRNEVTGLFYVEDIYITVLKNFKPIFKDFVICVEGKEYKPYEFIKLLRNTKDGAEGVGLTDEIAKALQTAYDTLLYQLSLVRAGGAKKGFLKAQRKLAQPEINALKQAWKNMYSDGTESVIVLNNGLEFQPSSATSTEMQLNENKTTLAGEINGIFHLNTLDFYEKFKEAIYPIVKAFETELNRVLLLEKEKKNHYFEFDVKEIIRANLNERYQAYKLAKETGFMTLNEIRRAENMEYIEGLDVINVGLGAVLYDVNAQKYFTPNTGQTSSIDEENIDTMLENHEMAEAYDESGNSAERMEERGIVAVDFDNTITKNGAVNEDAVKALLRLQKKGHRLVLWTARTGDKLKDALAICEAKGLVFDGILPNKPNVDAFIDDKSFKIKDVIQTREINERFNPNHDAKTGRFSAGNGTGGGVTLLDDEFKGTGSIDDPANINKVVDGKIKMTYVKVTGQNTQNYGSKYGQNIEPSGEYMSMDVMKGSNKIQGYEYGTITFNKPLIVEWKSTGENGWKADLSQKYGGKTGKSLSNAIKKDGYDAIITVDGGWTSEIVNLNGVKS